MVSQYGPRVCERSNGEHPNKERFKLSSRKEVPIGSITRRPEKGHPLDQTPPGGAAVPGGRPYQRRRRGGPNRGTVRGFGAEDWMKGPEAGGVQLEWETVCWVSGQGLSEPYF